MNLAKSQTKWWAVVSKDGRQVFSMARTRAEAIDEIVGRHRHYGSREHWFCHWRGKYSCRHLKSMRAVKVRIDIVK